MENTLEIILWSATALIASGMIFVLTIGWMKGNKWQRELKMRKQQADRYQ